MRRVIRRENRLMAVIGGGILFCAGLVGCSGISHEATRATLEPGGAEAPYTIAQLYYQQAEAKHAEAALYERRAASLGEYADSKGFVRNGLISAAKTYRAEARDLEQLAAFHEAHPDVAAR